MNEVAWKSAGTTPPAGAGMVVVALVVLVELVAGAVEGVAELDVVVPPPVGATDGPEDACMIPTVSPAVSTSASEPVTPQRVS